MAGGIPVHDDIADYSALMAVAGLLLDATDDTTRVELLREARWWASRPGASLPVVERLAAEKPVDWSRLGQALLNAAAFAMALRYGERAIAEQELMAEFRKKTGRE